MGSCTFHGSALLCHLGELRMQETILLIKLPHFALSVLHLLLQQQLLLLQLCLSILLQCTLLRWKGSLPLCNNSTESLSATMLLIACL